MDPAQYRSIVANDCDYVFLNRQLRITLGDIFFSYGFGDLAFEIYHGQIGLPEAVRQGVSRTEPPQRVKRQLVRMLALLHPLMGKEDPE